MKKRFGKRKRFGRKKRRFIKRKGKKAAYGGFSMRKIVKTDVFEIDNVGADSSSTLVFDLSGGAIGTDKTFLDASEFALMSEVY